MIINRIYSHNLSIGFTVSMIETISKILYLFMIHSVEGELPHWCHGTNVRVYEYQDQIYIVDYTSDELYL